MYFLKCKYLPILIFLASCNNNTHDNTINASDSLVQIPAEPKTDTGVNVEDDITIQPAPPSKVYSNARFKDVTVTKVGDNKYTIQGKGQIFEASFGWVVEDGHNEIKEGFDMTDAGAPEWGNFKFTMEVQKQRPNSTLTLILFESSAKDGSRVYQLPIVLE